MDATGANEALGLSGWFQDACRIDPRAGGGFHYYRRSSEGFEFWIKGVYREVVVPERIALTEFLSDEDGNVLRHRTNRTWPLKLSSTLTCSEQRGRTLLRIQMVPESATEAERRTFEAAYESVETSIRIVLNRLVEYVPKTWPSNSAKEAR